MSTISTRQPHDLLSHRLDRILCRLARHYASARTPCEDLVQEARLAAWKASRLPNAATTGFVMRAAKWAIFAYLDRERKEAHLSLDRDHCNIGSQLTTPDFAPALIEVMDRGESVQAVCSAGDEPLNSPSGDKRVIPSLSNAERTVLDWVCRGLEYKEIAVTLECSASAVKFHLVNVYRKLDCRNSIEAYNSAMRAGLVEPPPIQL